MNRFIAVAVVVALPVFAASPKDEVSKPLKTIVNSVRYGKDLVALKQFAVDEQGKYLMGEAWARGTDAQRKEFSQLFLDIFGKVAFPRIRKNFEHLDTVLYEEPALTGDEASIVSTILINHPLKKQELKATYTLKKLGGTWKVVDVLVKGLGNSFLSDVRDQIDPLYKEGGWEGVLQAMREKNAELKDVVLK